MAESFVKCQFCKKGIHEACIKDTLDEDLFTKVLSLRSSFNCQNCLELESPKMIEDTCQEKIHQVNEKLKEIFSTTVEEQPKRALIAEQSQRVSNSKASMSIENENEIVDLELEEICPDEAKNHDEPSEQSASKEDTIDITTDPDETNSPQSQACCMWDAATESKCDKCEELTTDKSDLESKIGSVNNKLQAAEEEIISLKIKLVRADEESTNMKNKTVSLKEQLDTKIESLEDDVKEKSELSKPISI